MAREYTQIPTELLREDEFRALTAGQQHAFLMLCCRPEHGSLGVLPLLLSRFANTSTGLDPVELLDHVRRLALSGWVALDEEEGELFVLRFMEFHNVGQNPNRLRAAVDEVDRIESPLIRAAAADVLAQMQRLDAQRAADRLRRIASGRTRPQSRPGISVSIRTAVYRRDGWRCVYCGHQFQPVNMGAPEDEAHAIWLELDHVKPYSLGGNDTFENLRAACSTCNRRRGVDDLDLWADKLGGA